MSFAEHIRTNHFMTLEGLARKLGVSYGVLRGVAAGTHKNQFVIDKLIEGGYIASAEDLPPCTNKIARKVTALGIKYNSKTFCSNELLNAASIGDTVFVCEAEDERDTLCIYKEGVFLCKVQICTTKSQVERG